MEEGDRRVDEMLEEASEAEARATKRQKTESARAATALLLHNIQKKSARTQWHEPASLVEVEGHCFILPAPSGQPQ